MFLRIKRHLMAEADAGGGNGATPTPAPAADVPQAQGDAISLSKTELDALVASAAAKAVQDAKDSIFAEARRTFTDKKKDSKPKVDEPVVAAAPMSATDERALLRNLDRYIATKGIKPNAAQYARAEKTLLSEQPADINAWAADYFDGFSVVAPQPQQSQAAQDKPAADHPVSNRGAPAAAKVPLEEADLVTMSDSDRKAYIAAKGPRAYVQALQKQLKGRPVVLR